MVETKPDRSPVTRADRETEEVLRSAIARSGRRESVLGEEFGEVRTSGGSPAVSSLVSLADAGDDERRLLASVATGETYQLWSSTSPGTWDQMSVPVSPEVGSERSLTVAARGDDVLLLADDAAQGRVWVATWP